MPISPVNQVKNVLTPVNSEKGTFYLLTEDGDYLVLENNFFIMLDGTVSVETTNQAKNAATLTNANKS